MGNSTSDIETYDVEAGIAEARRFMRLGDPVSLRVYQIAEDYAKATRSHFQGRDLRIVAEAMVTSSASLGVFMDSQLSISAMNIQAVAAALIIDELAAEQSSESTL